jgi:hypothetical protein
LGNAKRARELQRLFEAWRQAFDAQDIEAMAAARRAIDATMAGNAPRAVDVAAVSKFFAGHAAFLMFGNYHRE